MVSKKLVTIVNSSRNSLSDSWYITWITFHNGIDGGPTIKFFTDRYREKDRKQKPLV